MMRAWYLVREALTNLRVYRGSVAIGIVTTAFALACFGVFLLLYLNLHNLAGSLQRGIDVVVYLNPDAPEQTVAEVRRRLREEPAAVTVSVVSKAQALREFRDAFPDDALFLGEMGDNPLPVSFVVTVSPGFQTPESVSAFAERVEGFPGVAHVRYHQDWIDTLALVVSYFEFGAVVIGVILAVATVTIVGNTVHLSLQARREEIEILRLIGATGRFIAVPHVIEGAMLGAVGGGLALALLKGAFEFLRFELYASGWFDGLERILTFFPDPVSLLLVLAGMALGCGGSVFSIMGLIKTRQG